MCFIELGESSYLPQENHEKLMRVKVGNVICMMEGKLDQLAQVLQRS